MYTIVQYLTQGKPHIQMDRGAFCMLQGLNEWLWNLLKLSCGKVVQGYCVIPENIHAHPKEG